MPRAHNGRRRLPSNAVYRAIQGAGGPSAVCKALTISLATLARWRRSGRVLDAVACLEWAALLAAEPTAQLAAARRLAGLPPQTTASRSRISASRRAAP
jgi:hypothetical protein